MSRETFILQQQSTVPAPKTGSLVREDSGVGQKDESSKLQLLPLSGDALHLEWCGRHLMSGQGTPGEGGHGDWGAEGPEREHAHGGSADRLAVEISTESLIIACCHSLSFSLKHRIIYVHLNHFYQANS